MLLLQKWQEVVKRRGDAPALRDRSRGETWTFRELAAALDDVPIVPRGESPRVTRATGSRLILETLAAWRDGSVFCPLEADSPAPPIDDPGELPDGIAHVKLTSGSTGEPRGVLFRPEQLLADADNIVATMGLRPEWPNLGVISLTHSYGFSNLVLPLLLHGIALDWLGDPLPGAVAGVLNEEIDAPLTLAAVPAMWRAWHGAGALAAGAKRVALAISAGAPLPGELEKRIYSDFRIKVHNFYGSSECGGIAYDRSELPRDSPERIGEPMSNVHLSLTDDGCLVVSGAAVGEGYWPRSEENSAQLGGGRFVTSDMADLVASECAGGAASVILAGRRDDLINVAGRKVSPPRVEAAILEDGSVRHCVVFGVSAREAWRMEDSVAIVAPVEGSHFDLGALRLRIAGRLQRHELPRRWWVCEDLAPDRRGKISRTRWRNRFLQHVGRLVPEDGECR